MMRKNVPLIMQSSSDDCAIACLTMVINYLGSDATITEVNAHIDHVFGGMTFKEIVNAAEIFGLNARILSMSADSLKNMQGPLILYWGFNHAVVYDRANKDSFWINDPAKGRYNIPQQELDKYFTGICIELTKKISFDEAFLPKKDHKNTLKSRLLRHSFKASAATLLPLILLSDLSTLIITISIKFIFDNFAIFFQSPYAYMSALPVLLVVILRSKIDASFVESKIALCKKLNISISSYVYSSIMANRLEFFINKGTGAIANVMSLVEVINDGIMPKLITSLANGFSLVLICSALVFLSQNLFFLTLGVIFISILMKVYYSRKVNYLITQSVTSSNEERSTCIENVKSVFDMRSQGVSDVRRSIWFNKYINKCNSAYRSQVEVEQIDTRDKVLFGADLVIFTLYGVHLISIGTISFGDFLAFAFLKELIREKIKSISDAIIQLSHLEAYCSVLEPYTSAETNGEGQTPRAQLSERYQLSGNLSLRGVSFKHPGSTSLLFKDFSFSLTSGETVLIEGESGAGKSTLVSLISGVQLPTSGLVSYDNIPASHLSDNIRRNSFVVITQSSLLYSGSIADNITLFSKDIDHERLVKAMEATNIADRIMRLPLNYGTYITDSSSIFSAGETQRIILARCFYFKPSIIILDEATSNLDELNEQDIMSKLMQLTATKILVTHRPSAILGGARRIKLS